MTDEFSKKIIFSKLSRVILEKGNVLHALKSNEETFHGFGEAYFSIINSGSIKAWKKHQKMIMSLIVPKGNVGFIFYDEDKNCFAKYSIGEKNYGRLTVYPGLWFGFIGLDSNDSLILNISNIVHDENEIERKNLEEINFEW